MKKYFVLLLGLALLFTGCEKANKANDYLDRTVWKCYEEYNYGLGYLEFLGGGKVAHIYNDYRNVSPQYGTYKVVDETKITFNLTVTPVSTPMGRKRGEYQFKNALVTLTTLSVTATYADEAGGAQDMTLVFVKK